MRTLFFGTSAFAVPSLEAVAEATQLQGVITQPDRPAGRGQKLMPSPVKVAAQKLGVSIHEPLVLRQAQDDTRFARARGPEPVLSAVEAIPQDDTWRDIELFVVASYGKILPQWLLDIPKLGALNVHPSLLPKYRGATPIQAALRNGDTETGVTIMLMDAGMDTGDIVLQEKTPIFPDEDYGQLHDVLAAVGAALLERVLRGAKKSGTIPHRAQSGEASLTKPIRKEDLQLDWSWGAEKIVNTVRAYSPTPAARAVLFGLPVKIIGASKTERPGALKVECGGGEIWITQLIAPGKPLQSGAQFAQSLKK